MSKDGEPKVYPRLNSCYKCGGPLYTMVTYQHGILHADVKCPKCDE